MNSNSKMLHNFYEQNAHLPYQIRFENALKEPIITKCQMLTDLIFESLSTNIKEIQQRFVILIEDIFSFSLGNVSYHSIDWKLKSITRETNMREFDHIYQFLNTDGPLFKLIRQIMVDPNNHYEFPIICLPTSTRIAFVDGFITNFYANKISQNLNSISLNAFEFFMFHFAYFITNQNAIVNYRSNLDFASNENTNVLYYVLLENYLDSFLPLPSTLFDQEARKNLNTFNMNESQSLWKSLSSTTTNILNMASNKNDSQFKSDKFLNTSKLFDNNFQNTSIHNNFSSIQTSPVINSKILTLNKLNQNLNTNIDRNPNNDILGTLSYKSETVLNIFTEMWLNHATNSSNVDENKKLKNVSYNSFNFSVEHMRVVRIFVKHLHYFANTVRKKNFDVSPQPQTQYNSGGVVTSTINDPLDELKRNLWSSKYPIQKKLYQFFRLAFDRWPNDSSFRLPLETWLSYIQPWRYISKFNTNKPSDEDRNVSQNNLFSDYSDWKRFISENLFFYTIIFRQVMTRIAKILDLNLASSSLLLYRTTKVFSQENLRDLIKESEFNLLNGSDLNLNRSNLNHNLLSPSIRQHISNVAGASFKHALMEMESSPFEYVSIFSPQFRDEIINLLLQITKSLYSSDLAKQSTKTETSDTSTSNNFFSSFINFFSIESNPVSNSQSIESSKTKHYLESSISNISLIFEIQQQSIQTIMSNEKNALLLNEKMDSVDSSLRDNNAFEIVDGVPKLSEIGRNLILNGQLKHKHLPNLIEGNPDLQPVRTFEIGFLVMIASFVSKAINKACGNYFAKIYNYQSFIGILLRQILSPPIKYVRFVKSNNRLKTDFVTETLPPRVNLRFIASKMFFFYFVILWILSYLFNYSMIFLITLFAVMSFSYVCTKSTLMYLKIN